MAPQRPRGRAENVTNNGKGVAKHGEGLGGGPAGRTGGSGQGSGSQESGGRPGNRPNKGYNTSGSGRGSGGGGRSPLTLIILAAIVLLGGGGGLSGLLGNLAGSSSGGSSDSSWGNYTYNSGNYSGYNDNPYASGYDYSDSSSTTTDSSVSSSDTGVDLSGLLELFGSQGVSSMTSTTSGWVNEPANTGKLNMQVAAGARDKFTDLSGRNTKVNVMVYMCGTDLESNAAMATKDLTEMTKADLSDNVNVLVYTGGCKKWQNNVISSSVNQIYRVHNGGLEKLVEDDGTRNMTDPATLTRFLNWCKKNYPADRNQLIFWDHGGGSISGYGYDQKYGQSGSMDLGEIREAIDNTGMKFDFVGFDACLMATAENALSLSDYADYLIASEESEPGTGWYYTDWLTALSQDPSMETTLLGKQIIDDYVTACTKAGQGSIATLSLVDLAELEATMPKKFSAFAKDTDALLTGTDYRKVSKARGSAREFAQSSGIDQVDLVDMAEYIGSDAGKDLAKTLLSAIKYNRTGPGMTSAYGLSIFFPQKRLNYVDSMAKTYKEIGLDTTYTKCIQKYATLSTSGQATSGHSQSVSDLLGSFGGYGSSSSNASDSYQSYYNSSSLGSSLVSEILSQMLTGRAVSDNKTIEALGDQTQFLEESGLSEEEVSTTLAANWFGSASLAWAVEDDTHILHLSEDQWDLVTTLDQNLFFDDGEGYIDMGMDNLYSFTEEGDLIGDTDRTWLSIDGQPVAYYHLRTVEDGDDYTILGRVPVLLNGERSNLLLAFDQDQPYGYVVGVIAQYDEDETMTVAKASEGLSEGDEIQFICDYYSYDGKYQDTYKLGDLWTYEGQPEISNTDVGDGGAIVTYCFTDIYGQKYWTEPIEE